MIPMTKKEMDREPWVPEMIREFQSLANAHGREEGGNCTNCDAYLCREVYVMLAGECPVCRYLKRTNLAAYRWRGEEYGR
jgi:hypothetical protein